jgi:phosphoribosylanthranilate isomerase
MAAAVAGGARLVGLVFYPPSPRALSPAAAARLTRDVPGHVGRVGLFVDPEDGAVAEVVDRVPLDLLQLHGAESPARVRELKQRFGLPVIKAIKIAERPDLDTARPYLDAADWLLFDARPPSTMTAALPGGNALSFDWSLLAGRSWPRPWILAGGIDCENVALAVARSGAVMVDVSSGVEDAPGRKSVEKITAFLEVVATLDPGP